MDIEVKKQGNLTILDVFGEMSLYNSSRLKEVVKKLITTGDHSFIINMKDVKYIDSAGIGVLVSVTSTIKAANLGLAITNVHGAVKRVIEITQLETFFPLRDSVDEAIRELSS